jgi:lysophospholipase L1-like esterase
LLYKKSITHGYYEFWPTELSHWNNVRTNFNLNHRNDDLLNLIDAMIGDEEAIKFFNQEKEKKIFKIALIGDSMMFGSGVKKNQTLSSYLQKQLGRRVKVYNFSFSGDDILDNYIKYVYVEKYLEPNVIVLGLVSNDLIFSNLSSYPLKESEYKKLSYESSEKIMISINDPKAYVDYEFEDLVRNLYLPSFKPDTQNFYFLTQIATKIDLDKTILLSYACPIKLVECLDKNDYGCLDRSIYYDYLSVFNEEKTVLDFCEMDYMRISEKEGHPNAKTNKNLAKALANLIEEKYLK